MSLKRNRQLILASGVGVVQRLAQLLTTLITFPLVLHALGMAGFGEWGAATSLSWISGMLDLGFGSALVTLVPRALSGGRTDEARNYVTAALLGAAGLSILVLSLEIAAISLVGIQTIGYTFVIAFGALALNIPLGMGSPIWYGLQKGYIASAWELFQTLLTLMLIVLSVHRGAGVIGMVSAVFGGMLVANVGSLAHLMVGHPRLRPTTLIDWPSFRRVMSQGGFMFGITVAAAAGYAFDNLMALAWLGAAASAQMTIAMRVCTTATGMLAVVSQPFWPAFAEAIAAGDHRWVWRAFRSGSMTLFALAMLGSCGIVMVGGPVLSWWMHRDLGLSPALLWTIAAWIVITTLPHIPGFFLNSVLKLKPQLIILGVSAALSLVIKYLVARRFGVVGLLSIYPVITLFFAWPTYLWLVWSTINELNRPEGR